MGSYDLMYMNLFKTNSSVHVYDAYKFICEIVGLVVVSSNTLLRCNSKYCFSIFTFA